MTVPQNRRDADGSCIAMSLSSSEAFEYLAEQLEFSCTPANRNQDMNEHWDYLLSDGQDEWTNPDIKVELKAMKRMSRSGKVQDTWAWIELHGVREDEKGWLINSKADYICFEREDRFEFYPRLELLGRVLLLTDLTEWVEKATEAKYKLYSRRGRPDILTMVEFDKLKDILAFTWNKKEED